MNESIPVMLSWLGKHRRQSPDASINTGWVDGRDVQEGFCIKGVDDIEESVWAPKYGLKGKIDATVEVTFQQDSSAPVSAFVPGGIPSCMKGCALQHSYIRSRRLVSVLSGNSELCSSHELRCFPVHALTAAGGV